MSIPTQTQQPEPFGVLITGKDMYLEMVQLRETVGRLIPPAEQLADHERRIRKVERWVWSVPSSLLVSGAAIYLSTRH